jgi:hypothetical protein
MDRIARALRNVAFVVLLAAAGVATERELLAASCNSIGMWGYINYDWCGPFYYENEAYAWFQGDADWRCSAYYFPGAQGYPYYFYWAGYDEEYPNDSYYNASFGCY